MIVDIGSVNYNTRFMYVVVFSKGSSSSWDYEEGAEVWYTKKDAEARCRFFKRMGYSVMMRRHSTMDAVA